jgi:hypothetical protein
MWLLSITNSKWARVDVMRSRMPCTLSADNDAGFSTAEQHLNTCTAAVTADRHHTAAIHHQHLKVIAFKASRSCHACGPAAAAAAGSNTCRRECLAWGDPSLLLSARKGAVVQLQRKGLFVVDELQLKPGTAAAAAAAAAAVAAAGAGAGAGAAANAGAVPGSTAADDASSTPDESAYMLDDVAVVPTGAEDLKAAAAAAAQDVPVHKVSLTPGLQISDVQQLVLFAIPDGHTKHEMM